MAHRTTNPMNKSSIHRLNGDSRLRHTGVNEILLSRLGLSVQHLARNMAQIDSRSTTDSCEGRDKKNGSVNKHGNPLVRSWDHDIHGILSSIRKELLSYGVGVTTAEDLPAVFLKAVSHPKNSMGRSGGVFRVVGGIIPGYLFCPSLGKIRYDPNTLPNIG